MMSATPASGIVPTRRYGISETCALLGIHRNTLRKWTARGTIKCEYRKADMRKLYRGSEISRLMVQMM